MRSGFLTCAFRSASETRLLRKRVEQLTAAKSPGEHSSVATQPLKVVVRRCPPQDVSFDAGASLGRWHPRDHGFRPRCHSCLNRRAYAHSEGHAAQFQLTLSRCSNARDGNNDYPTESREVISGHLRLGRSGSQSAEFAGRRSPAMSFPRSPEDRRTSPPSTRSRL